MNFGILEIFLFVSIAHHVNASPTQEKFPKTEKFLNVKYKSTQEGTWVDSHLAESTLKYPHGIADATATPLIFLLPSKNDNSVQWDNDACDVERIRELVMLSTDMNIIIARFENVKAGSEAQHVMNKFLGGNASKTVLINMNEEYASLTDKTGKPYPSQHKDPEVQQALENCLTVILGVKANEIFPYFNQGQIEGEVKAIR